MIGTQITTAKPDWIGVEYSTVCPFNSDNSRLLLVKRDHFGLWDGSGRFITDLPIPASAEPRWSSDPRVFYWLSGNRLMKWTEGYGGVPIRVFGEYESIHGGGEGDLVNNRLALAGGNEVFTFNIITQSKEQVYRVGPFDGLKLQTDGAIVVSSDDGLWRYRANTPPEQLTRKNGHAAIYDSQVIWANAASNPVTPVGCDNGLVLLGATPRCLVKLPWSMACHISTCAQPFCLVSTYGKDDGSLLSNKLVRVFFNGTVEILGSHGSNPIDYEAQPKASLSRDGSKFVYCSNMGSSTPHYSEVFLATIAPTGKWVEVPIEGQYRIELDGQKARLLKWS